MDATEKDERIQFMSAFVLKTTRVKYEKWTKMLSTDEYKEKIMRFCDNQFEEKLIFTLNSSGLLTAMSNFSTNPRGKSCYFVRRTLPTEITRENLRTVLLIGNVLSKPLEDLSTLTNHVFLPLLKNPANQINCPNVILKDIEIEIQKLKNSIAELKGNMNKKTILTLPISIDHIMLISPSFFKGEISLITSDIRNSLEVIVLKWGKVIDECMKEEYSITDFKQEGLPVFKELFEFWESRLNNLENIAEQFRDIRIKTIGHILDSINSTYFSMFKSSLDTVLNKLTEARDITICLLPLQNFAGKLEVVEFPDTLRMIKPLLNIITLVWANSKHFGTNDRMSVLFNLVHNLLITSSTKYLDPDSLFRGEMDETLIRLSKVIEIFSRYREYYELCGKNLSNTKTAVLTSQNWTWHPNTVFKSYDLYVARLKEIYEVFEIGTEFLKLEKVEVGGPRGRYISKELVKILEEFNSEYREWENIQFNPLDPDPDIKDFQKAKHKFMDKTNFLSRRLAYQFQLAFDNCNEINQMIQLIQMCGSLLHINVVKQQITPSISIIIEIFSDNLDSTKILFEKTIKEFNIQGFRGIPIDRSFPYVSGTLMWLNKLRDRVLRPYKEFSLLDFPVFANESGEYAMKRLSEVLIVFENFEKRIFNNWCSDVANDIASGTNKMILYLNKENGTIQINFDGQLITALKDIKHLKNMRYSISDEILSFFAKTDEFWRARVKLLRITEWYNYIREKTHSSELKLIEEEINQIDEILRPAYTTINWNNFEQIYINEVFEKTELLYDRICKTQNNIEILKMNIDSWGRIPLYQRKDGNPKSLLNIEDRNMLIEKRFLACLETKDLINKIMKTNLKLFFNLPIDSSDLIEVQESKMNFGDTINDVNPVLETPPELQSVHLQNVLTSNDKLLYRLYEDHIDGLVGDGIIQAILSSLNYIKNEMDNRNKTESPIFEIKMDLRDSNLLFKPEIHFNSNDSFVTLVDTILFDIVSMSSKVPRVIQNYFRFSFAYDINSEEEESYLSVVKQNVEIRKIQEEIQKKVKLVLFNIKSHAKQLSEYAFLWTEDMANYLREFKTYSRPLKKEERDMSGEDSFKMKEESPSLDKYKSQIEKFNSLYEEVKKWENFRNFNIWLRLDKKKLKKSLLKMISKWSNMFKQDLIDRVANSLQELEDFTVEAKNVMRKEIDKDDLQGLIQIMSILNQINDRQIRYDFMFEPLREVVEVLKEYDYEFSEHVHLQFAELPEAWMKIKKMGAIVRQYIAPIQAYQVDLIEKRIILFENRVTVFRDYFLNLQFFRVPCNNVYEICNKANEKLTLVEADFADLTKSVKLFDLKGPNESRLIRTRKELKMIKQLWDYLLVVDTNVNDWKRSPWNMIDIDMIDTECKRYMKELRSLDKDVRIWDPYTYAESTLRNLVVSLRAVTELQNPAIRQRHWTELMQTTKVKFHMDDSTTLSDLLELNLHKYEDQVHDIVDKSVKEMAMEKVIKDVENIWNTCEFQYDIHDGTNLKVIKINEDIIEILEDHQNQLQNLLSSKYITFFFDEVTNWQIKLSIADLVINAWMEVQRKWMYLESIFIDSQDIRIQLPEDSKLFDVADREFRTLLNVFHSDRNIIHGTNRIGLLEKIEFLNKQLMTCEKALNDYLETKRLAYPRFYFISSVDLLHILSNGNRPDMVEKHLSKLYDSLAKLDLISGTKNAKGMISKEHSESVPFREICDCSGNVEIWLNRITYKMRETLRIHIQNAVIAYEEKLRHVWIFDWQAQVALCTTQIWWAIETNAAFGKLDLGYENSLKDFQKKQVNQLNALISLLLGNLTAAERQKIMTVCTIDVHSRDVVAKLISQKVESFLSFQWQSQLRHRWDKKSANCYVNICDAQFKYDYEYLGNTPRLVITPLTDRCYITLTQSLHLIMGGAPAGPAGTGKTETTKDLGRALGIMVYVFNCSEQMDYKTCGNIHKGLAQTGAWGCFDEFNRISVEVLSVIAVQVKSIQNAIKAKNETFNFMGSVIKLVPTVGMFITMNPGYAGRTELPENLKALYRPCAMVVPDFALICEIMLVAEGFQEARLLARKFITLYMLCKELLSKQDHYDWGLRAIKSVLVVAGTLRRDDRSRAEDQVLMRALRDFNIPKIITDDKSIFMGLIGDLFPALDVPPKRDFEFELLVKKSAAELKLQSEDAFVLKVVQLNELFAVRHSVFIIGNAGAGKTEVWKTLYRTYQNQNRKPTYNDINPKVLSSDELFGVVNRATREWKDGLFSTIMRDQTNMSGNGPKWIVLDGDIDPMWIESLNTVMDDNKILTLASNERIALTKEMRLLFEITNLKTATPATVSRAGILYVNPQDLGWVPYITSWLNTRKLDVERSALNILFEKYMPPLLELFKTKMKKITPIPDIALLQMTVYLLDCLLTPDNLPVDCPKEWYEIYFVFAVIWGFGSCLFQDQIIDWRKEFHKWWINEFKMIKFPSNGNIFDFYIDPETKKFVPWSNLVPSFELKTDIPLQSTLVHTAETIRLKYFIDILVERNHPVMLIGSTGSGKSVIVNEKLNSLSDKYIYKKVPFNFYTTSDVLQRVLEKDLEKKAGRNYTPKGNKSMIYFVDDLNMPEMDIYGTVQPHTLIRQFMDYHHWYDRTKLILKEIKNCQFIACMNHTAGTFIINERLQRHFCSFAVNAPETGSLFQILHSILSQHLSMPQNKFSTATQNICENLVRTAIALHQKVRQMFLPTAIKFHYNFNLRDITNIFTGILFANGETAPTTDGLIRLWLHEASRVYRDKLIDLSDIENFNKLIADVLKKNIEEFNDDFVFRKPLIYSHFAQGLTEPKYMPVDTYDSLNKLLMEAQDSYNEVMSATNLVLFEDAMGHICRISRILESPRGNALLVGVGGSGKQSLTRLAAFISSLDVFQVKLTKDYSINDLRNDLATLYMKTGLKNIPCCFLMTDAQVSEEQFLVLINDLLASGEIHELFPDEEMENIIGTVRNEVKQLGISDSTENCWKYFIDKVRGLLKVVLCFSPVGSTLRVRARKFPAIVNCTSIDWFHDWPREALLSVSYKFLSNSNLLPLELCNSISNFMAFAHDSVNRVSQNYLENDKRYNYTTPKTFLELLALYAKLLNEKIDNNNNRINRLENGILKLLSCSEQVDALQAVLQDQEVLLQSKNEDADKLIAIVSLENEKVQKERNYVSDEEKKVRTIEEDVIAKAKLCEEDLRRAQPALLAAQAALNTLNKNNLTELKSFGSPPEAVVNVCSAVLVLFSSKGKIPKDRSWKACKVLMGKADKFLDDLIKYDKEHIPSDVIHSLQPYLKDPEFNPEKIISKSSAAAGLCAWVININKFYEVFLVVEPKQRALQNAQNELKAAREKLEYLNNKLNELEDKLNIIQKEFDVALAEKQKCQDEADATSLKIDLAVRLVNGLETEKHRWKDSIHNLKGQIITLPGDIVLVSCFISYFGCFTKPYRVELLKNNWLPKFKNIQPAIPCSEETDPFDILCDDAEVAEWNKSGLPSDRMSAENAAIFLYSQRYPLIIDPQLQGIRWIKNKYGKQLIILRLTKDSYLDVIERAVSDGSILLIENIDETIDAVLEPLLSRSLIKKGTCLMLGDKQIDFNPNFRLIIQTKLANPHYKPEIQAQTTLINFTVTREGLEDQLLAKVVQAERTDLEQMRMKLTMQQNNYKITLKFLEDDLLQRLSSAGDNILDDTDLVLNLEKTKKTADEVELKVKEAKTTSIQINQAREFYRPAAKKASILYFILNELFKINPIYQFSLRAFLVVFGKAIAKARSSEKISDRVTNLIDAIMFNVYIYTSRALFEKDKMIFLFQMALQTLLADNEIEIMELDFLLKYPYIPNLNSPFSFLSNESWGGIKALSQLDSFRGLDKDLEGSHKRWQKFVEAEFSEKEKFPGEWKSKNALQKLCMMRALRPDRMLYAIKGFITEKLGEKYVEFTGLEFASTFNESNSSVHIFFILSPGVDPLKDVEKHGKLLGYSMENSNFHSVSLGQGQEIIAENSIDFAAKEGHWVILQNIHLVAKWLPSLERRIALVQNKSHDDFRLFLSAEPASSPEYHILPQGILESAIKITNEPPSGMHANLHKALNNFNQETLEMCTKETEFKAILFSLCYFHAVVAERRKFGSQGWNRNYPFNVGDLTISVYVLFNYLEANNRIPWEDLRYLFGEIMYGGHITDDWDRKLCNTYLEEFMQPDLIDGDLEFCPGFPAPPNMDFIGYHKYIDDVLPTEHPSLYGLHTNSEIGFLTSNSEKLLKTIFEIQPRMGASQSSENLTNDEIVKNMLEDIIDKIPQPFNMMELIDRVSDWSPYVIVALQECERMNILMHEISRTLKELELGLKGELTITSDMENLTESLFFDRVPDSWCKLAYPSMLGLQSWLADVMLRLRQIELWSGDFRLPASIWLGGFFNPQSFLTAVMQQTARKNEWPLDKMCLNCDVTKKTRDEITSAPREGAYVDSLFMEGARWDIKLGAIADARLKELFPLMPVIYIKAITQDKQDVKNIYKCPVYKIRMRGPTYVWTFNLKTKEKSSKWTLAGVCLLLQT